MTITLRLVLSASLCLSCVVVDANTYKAVQSPEAYERCMAKLTKIDGVWQGRLLTPGADEGGPYDKRVDVRLVFSRTDTTLLVKLKPEQPWRKVGNDPVPAQSKTDLIVNVPSKDARDPLGHQVVFIRLDDSSASVIYSRGQIAPKPGEKVAMTDMRAGVAVREGSPVPTGPVTLRSPCAPPAVRIKPLDPGPGPGAQPSWDPLR